MTEINRIKLFKEIKKTFNRDDKREPFLDREYVEETNRVIDLLMQPIGDYPDATDRAIYDIVSDILREINKVK